MMVLWKWRTGPGPNIFAHPGTRGPRGVSSNHSSRETIEVLISYHVFFGRKVHTVTSAGDNLRFMHVRRGGSANLAACPPHNQHPIIDRRASHITQTPSLNTTNSHRDSVHLLLSRLHNSTYLPLTIDTPSEQLQIQPPTPPGHHGFLRIPTTARSERLQCPE
jgi:hypothetical protein